MPATHHRSYTSQARQHAKSLRHNMTAEERHLWYDFLSHYRPRFYRQRAVGEYIADFLCPQAKLIIELDGAQHYEADTLMHDERRTHYLETCGYRVLRLLNKDVNQNVTSVCQLIEHAVEDATVKGRINS